MPFREWSACRNPGLQYWRGDSWEPMLQQSIMLLNRLCQDDRILIASRAGQPKKIKVTCPLDLGREAIA